MIRKKRAFWTSIIIILVSIFIITAVIFGYKKYLSVKRMFTSYTAQEVVIIYQDNKQIFQEATNICLKYDIAIPIDNWELVSKIKEEKYQEQAEILKKLSYDELNQLKKCIALGCNRVYCETETAYVNFSIDWNDITHQGILCISSTAKEKDIITILEEINDNHRDITYQKLEDNVYYYFLLG